LEDIDLEGLFKAAEEFTYDKNIQWGDMFFEAGKRGDNSIILSTENFIGQNSEINNSQSSSQDQPQEQKQEKIEEDQKNNIFNPIIRNDSSKKNRESLNEHDQILLQNRSTKDMVSDGQFQNSGSNNVNHEEMDYGDKESQSLLNGHGESNGEINS